MDDVSIGLAVAEDVAKLPEIERRAARLFSSEDLPPELAAHATSAAEYHAAQQAGRLIVARDPAGSPLGFAYVVELAGGGHLEELDVDPDFGRRGIGRRLVEAACGWASTAGFEVITLSTFRQVPWNAPFYARLGFEVLPETAWSDALRSLRENERELGLDLTRRVLMRRRLGATDRSLATRFMNHPG